MTFFAHTRAVAVRVVVLALLWWALAEGRALGAGPGTAVAALAVAGGAALSVALARPGEHRVRPSRVPSFVAFFLRQSLLGGIDVACRALLPSRAVRPGLVEHRTNLPAGSPRYLFVTVVGLLPGTLVVRDQGDRVLVHALDSSLPVEQSIAGTEARVRALFGLGGGPGGATCRTRGPDAGGEDENRDPRPQPGISRSDDRCPHG